MSRSYEEEHAKMVKLIKKLVICGVSAIVAVILAVQTVGVVPVNHTGVWKRAGVVQDEAVKEGWHLKIPFIDSIETISNLVQTTTVTYAQTKETAETKDQQLIMDYAFEIQHQLVPEQSFVVYKNYGKNYEQMLIASNVLPIIKQAFANYESEEITTHKEDIALYVQAKLQSFTEEFGIKILRVNFQSYDFTKEYDAILEERATLKARVTNEELRQNQERVAAQTAYDVAVKHAEQEAETARITADNNKKVALVKAEQDKETQLIQANAKAEAAKIEADNKAYVTITLANADRDARLAAAEATKAELEAQAAGLTDLVIQREWINRWNGKLIPNFGGSNGISFTNMTDIMKYFFQEATQDAE